jgi:hypothetical protein
MNFIHCFKGEWIKKKRSLAAWLVIIGGFFTPAIMIAIALYRSSATRAALLKKEYWTNHWLNSWESIAMFLLPLGIILSTSLVTQIEFKNNTWKQLHTSPQTFTNLFLAKLSVIVLMLLQFFLLFNLGTYLSSIIPILFIDDAHYPIANIPWKDIFYNSLLYFITSLPIIAIQYLVSLQFKNFLVSISVGLGLWVASIAGLAWKYSYMLPYSHGSLYYLKLSGRLLRPIPVIEMALAYFIIVIIISYILYITKKEKG